MLFEQDPHKDDILEIISDFDDELSIHKTLVEKSFERSESYSPMMIFYTDPSIKSMLVVPDNQSFTDLLPKISEVMHLYSAIGSSSVLVTIASKIAIDDVNYDSVNFFIAARHAAYIYYMPYTVENNKIIWHDEIGFAQELLSTDFDTNGQDLINIIRAHVHVENPAFNASEVLNYLSYQGYAIQFIDPNNTVPYIDMSPYSYTNN